MKTLNEKTLEELLIMSTQDIQTILKEEATYVSDRSWLFAPEQPKNKVCLVCHIDTVWDSGVEKNTSITKYPMNSFTSRYKPRATWKPAQKPKKRLYFDKKKNTLWSPDGLGGDDRAGVYSCLKLYNSIPEPHRPYLLITTEEETGCLGAYDAVDAFIPQLQNVLFFVELDRQGHTDAVFYNFEDDDFIKYIEDYGFIEQQGSFSDIAVLGESFMLSSVNLSIGYYNEHTKHEFLNINHMNATIEKTKQLIMEATKRWDLEVMYEFSDSTTCVDCHSIISFQEYKQNNYLCIYCYAPINDDYLSKYYSTTLNP